MKKSKLLHENGSFTLHDTGKDYTVFVNGSVYAVSDSVFAKSADGLSLATARCDYLAKRYPSIVDANLLVFRTVSNWNKSKIQN